MKVILRPGACNLFGPALKWAREQARPRLTQDDVAARITALGLPMDRTVVSRIENQKRSLSDIEFFYFTRAIRIDPLKLFQRAFRQPSDIALYEDIASELDDFEIRVAEDDPLN